MVNYSTFLVPAATSLLIAGIAMAPIHRKPTQVVFDLPGTIECRDATPPDFALAHPSLKVVEANFRISAQFVSGVEADVVDFLYVIASQDRKLRFQDYLPNTSLESAVAEDQVEITESDERSKSGELGAEVGYRGLIGGLSTSKGEKKSQTRRYKEIAPRELVVSSGTTDRGHGVFFKLKPSRVATLEGGKAFTFLATVPKTWRGGWCTISCVARANSKAWFSRSDTVSAGVGQSQVGLYLMGDAESNQLAEELNAVQQRYADIVAQQLVPSGFLDAAYHAVATGHMAALCGVFKLSPTHRTHHADQQQLEELRETIVAAQARLQRLSE